MGDIKKAIEIENAYLQQKMNGDYEFILKEEIIKCGYNSLTDYFDEKKNYDMKQINFFVEEVTPDNAADEIIRLIKNKIDGILLMDTDRTIVYHGSEPFNREYCEAHNIPVVDYLTNGGTLVASDGELSVGICIPDNINIGMNWMLNGLKDILSKYMDDVVVDNNDILVKGKKVCGSTEYRMNGRFAFIAQFSFDDKLDLIYNICPPVSGKIPDYIKTMTREQLRKEILEWLLE